MKPELEAKTENAQPRSVQPDGSAEPLVAHKPFKRKGVTCPKCQSAKVVLWHPLHREWIGAACQDCGKQFNLPNDKLRHGGE